jgi:GMC oxidoreductase
MASVSSIDPAINKTHDALFYTWFPLDRLDIPVRIRPDITAIAKRVKEEMLVEFNQSGAVRLLEYMTVPATLPFYDQIKTSKNPAIQKFIAANGGYGELSPEDGESVLGYFFELSAPTAELAMQIRELYLSGIWDLPLAVPLAQIQNPQIFVDDVQIYSERHYPNIPPSRLLYDPATQSIRHKDGPIEYLIVGGGPGGAAVAYELRRPGKRVVLIEQGPFVVWGSMNTMSYPDLMFQQDRATTSDDGVLVRSGQAMGGGTTVNIDLAFSPLESTIQARIDEWSEKGLIEGRYYTPERISAAYQWVQNTIGTRAVSESELNTDNLALWNGAIAFGVSPSLYHLNRFPTDLSPSPVTQKGDAARQLIVPAMEDEANPLSVIPDATVERVRCSDPASDGTVRAVGVTITMNAPWTQYGNTIVDPCQLGIPAGVTVSIDAENIILSAGTIGTTRILLQSSQNTPALSSRLVGKGLIMHPSVPLIGVFNKRINLLEGLDSATFLDAFGVKPGFIFETMSGLPAYGALLIPGSGKQVFDCLSRFDQSAGFGVMLVDESSESNCVRLENGQVVIDYSLTDNDKKRFRIGVGIAIRMMFLAGAKEVIIPSNENFLAIEDFNPMKGMFLSQLEQVELLEKHLQFLPNRTLLTSAHLQGTNKIGPSSATSVISTNQRVWNAVSGKEIENLYVADSSIFPTSVGANPMQSIYTFSKIFSERLIYGMNHDRPAKWKLE